LTPKSLIEPARHAGTALLRSQTDARLVDLTRDGNERAFEAIVQRYRRPLMRYCSRLLSPSRAEDAVQQAFLSAHRAIHAGDAELNLRPWLYRIAHNASLNLLRQHGYDHDEVSEEIDGVETPPQAFERGERLRTVVAAVQDLPDRQRSAIVLQAVEGRSYDEIATELGVSDGAVRQLLNRARNTLREAAAALTPTGLLTRIASSGGEATVAERIAQAVAGAGGGALIAKAGATLAIVGAVAGGAATGGLTGKQDSAGKGADSSAVASAPGNRSAPSSVPAGRRANVVLTGHHPESSSNGSGGGKSGSRDAPSGGARHVSGRGGNGGVSGRGGREDHHSGSSDDGEHSGGGDDGSGDRHSGSDDGSGSGDRSGSGGGGSDDSGSGDSGSSSSGSGDSSGSGSSGSSGSDSSGSDDKPDDVLTPAPAPMPTTSGSGSSGSSDSDDSPDTSDDGGHSGRH
jgi:RNA polymerase sigma factor (sigma-70 family)